MRHHLNLPRVSWTSHGGGCRAPSGECTNRPQAPYPSKFPAEAIRLARALGRSIRSVAMDLGISNKALGRWVIQTDIDHGDSPGLTTDERAARPGSDSRAGTLGVPRGPEETAAFFARKSEETR